MEQLNVKNWTAEFFREHELECLQILENPEILQSVPSLNTLSMDHFKNGQMVKFKGMIQDMYNPELYANQYKVINSENGSCEFKSGKYLDAVQCESNEQMSFENEDVTTDERQVIIMISVPGLNEWAKEKTDTETLLNTTSNNMKSKRSLDDCNDEEMDCSEPVSKKEKMEHEKSIPTTSGAGSGLNQNSSGTVLSKDHIFNFPIPIKDGKACIVKIYNDNNYKLNQVLELVAFLSVDPILSCKNSTDEFENDLERQTCHPPASLVPRLHVIKIISEKPLVPTMIDNKARVRGDLRILLSQLLFGDEIAADYLICHLISSVYLRKDCLTLGSFSLNITNFPVNQYKKFPKNFYDILTELVPKSHYIDFTLDVLNNESLVPKKDYDCNRLTSGILQLSNNTHLVIDETNLKPGQVTAFGRKNYDSLSQLIESQRIAYDFNYYTVDYDTDIPILIFSEVKSFIPCPMRVALKPDSEALRLYPEIYEAAKLYLKDVDRLNSIRDYLNELKYSSLEINDDMAKIIQEDFVRIRQSDKNFGGDDLHSLMVLARLMSLSNGLNILTEEMWKQSIAMEMERTSRLPKRK